MIFLYCAILEFILVVLNIYFKNYGTAALFLGLGILYLWLYFKAKRKQENDKLINKLL